MTNTHILILLGSLRAASVNRQLAEVAVGGAPERAGVAVYGDGPGGAGLGEVPFYNEDLDVDEHRPAAAVALRAAVEAADAVLIVTPEYNGGVPATVKNAIDWLSRPYGDSALKGKPAAVIGTALGRFGGVWAHDEVRKSLGIAGARVVESVTLSLPAKQLDGRHPGDVDTVAAAVREAVEALAGAVTPD
ncbi:FMN reductase [Mycolicibacterium insubricum]|uniref:FMN reductase n=1 Tax=Mycolicibacterium insubricum TaxID=444597 RepID=A0A1X0DKG2_9MYCO|nr:NAD(P)H-dependent oxidoreductase [Mycolicibacterium insubricum]MCB9440090.1 NAD(P)H-dependent oxidoreductase [Mycolicibacterium sp.]ORA72797.1 FMN reductase [Mycolicibacterium insubricum]BBZ66480.1 FMN reductase [Mycolicibacterium insubricum]